MKSTTPNDSPDTLRKYPELRRRLRDRTARKRLADRVTPGLPVDADPVETRVPTPRVGALMDGLLDDLLAELQYEISSAYIDKIKDFRLPDEIRKVNRAFFEFSCAQGKVFEKITCSSGSYSYIRQKMINRVTSETWEKSASFRRLDRFTQSVLLEHVNFINVNIYCKWISDGKRVPVEKLIELSDKLTCDGLHGIL